MQISKINNSFNVSMRQQNITEPEANLENTPIESEVALDTPAAEEVKKNSDKTGLVALGAIALGVAGLGYGIYKGRGSSSNAKELESVKKSLEEIKSNLTKKDKVIKHLKNNSKKLKAETKKQNEIISQKDKALKAANEKIRRLENQSSEIEINITKVVKEEPKKVIKKVEEKVVEKPTFKTRVKNFFKKLKFWGKKDNNV